MISLPARGRHTRVRMGMLLLVLLPSEKAMLSISRNPQTSALQDRLGHSVGSALEAHLDPAQGAALLVFCSLLPDDATLGDLGDLRHFADAGVAPDTLAAFAPLGARLRALPDAQRKAPLFDLFLSEVRLRSASRDGPPTHFETACPSCGARVAWPVQAGEDLKDRPLRCAQSHVFALSEGRFV